MAEATRQHKQSVALAGLHCKLVYHMVYHIWCPYISAEAAFEPDFLFTVTMQSWEGVQLAFR